ncbi:CBS domain containing protein (fragment) [Novosphingobium sp. KN65.2]
MLSSERSGTKDIARRGAAAGMTGIFGTPLAAILLAIEVLLFEWKPRSFVPVVVATMMSYALRPYLVDSGPMFATFIPLPQSPWALPTSGLIGLIVGLEAMVLSTSLYRIEDLFHKLPVHWMWWPAIGAITVGLGGMIDAHVLGAGYASIAALLDGSLSLKVALALLVVKAIVWLVALGSGTSGGVLAPLLILGGAAGFLVGQLLGADAGFWAMIGMAGIMSGAMRAPLTGAIFAAELTGQFDALPHTIIAAGSAYAVSVLLMRRSILTEKIARRGRHILQEYTIDTLDLGQADQLMTRAPHTLPGSLTIAEAVAFFVSEARYRSYPVIDAHGRLLGMVSRADALRWQSEGTLAPATLADTVSDAAQPVAYPDTTGGIVADLIIETGIGRIPVVERQTHKVMGIVSRQDLLKARNANRLAEIERDRFIGGASKA